MFVLRIVLTIITVGDLAFVLCLFGPLRKTEDTIEISAKTYLRYWCPLLLLTSGTVWSYVGAIVLAVKFTALVFGIIWGCYLVYLHLFCFYKTPEEMRPVRIITRFAVLSLLFVVFVLI